MDHFTDFPSFSGAFAGFVQEARKYGFNSGLQHSLDVTATALEGLWLNKDQFEYALAALFCTCQEEREKFALLYDRFWRTKGSRVHKSIKRQNQRRIHRKSSVAVMIGTGKSEEARAVEDAKNTSGANAKAIVKKTDFSKLTHSQSEVLDEIAERLVREMSLRIKRRKKKSKKGAIDVAASIRKNIQNGGTLINLSRLDRKKQRYRLLVLLDVSGSMDKYSFYLLKFLWALKSHFKDFEAFAFSTLMMRITDQIAEKDMARALDRVSMAANHWSSGTKIGECLQEFNDQFAKRYLNGNTLTVILSDGLDTGEPEILEEAIQKIKLRSKKLVWLNPLKGMAGYEPIQRGMQTAMPALNHFGAAHNFESLLELENLLIDA